MKLHFENRSGLVIQSYDHAGFTINGHLYPTHLIITPTHVVENWQPPAIPQLTHEFIEPALDSPLEVLILGTGKHLVFPPSQLIAQLAARRIGLEVMDTGAACRTYNILLSEGRQVAVALLLPSYI